MRIVGGSLDGLVGRFVRAKNSYRMVVSVTLLQRSVSVELSPDRVMPIRTEGQVPKSNKELLSGDEAIFATKASFGSRS